MGVRHPHDFSVAFKDTQKLQLIQQRLIRTQSVLDAYLVVTEHCQSLCRLLDTFDKIPRSGSLVASFKTHESQIRLYRGNIARMMEYSRGTMTLVCSPFPFPASALLLKENSFDRTALQNPRISQRRGDSADQSGNARQFGNPQPHCPSKCPDRRASTNGLQNSESVERDRHYISSGILGRGMSWLTSC
jgi:hypothetical protein